MLLRVLHRLRDHGNTIVVIEHNLDVIKTADWVIDMGPEGGDGGGEVIVTGTPEAVALDPRSHTGRYLARVLSAGRATTTAGAGTAAAAAGTAVAGKKAAAARGDRRAPSRRGG